MKPNFLVRLVALVLIPAVFLDPATVQAVMEPRASPAMSFGTAGRFNQEALAAQAYSIQGEDNPIAPPSNRLAVAALSPANSENPFENLKEGERRVIADRVYFIEHHGEVDIYWSQPSDFKPGDPVPITIVNTGMSSIGLVIAWNHWRSGKRTFEQYWRSGGLAAAFCEKGAAVAHIVGVKSPLGTIESKDVWQVSEERVRRPVEAIHKQYKNSPIHLVGHSVGAVLQACYLAKGGKADSAVLINTAFRFGKGVANLLRLEWLLRWCLLGGDDQFVQSLLPGTAAADKFIRGLQSRFHASWQTQAELVPILLVGTSTPEGIEKNLSEFPPWLAKFFEHPDSDGVVDPKLASNIGPDEKPVIPWAKFQSFPGITHDPSHRHPAIQKIAKDFARAHRKSPAAAPHQPREELLRNVFAHMWQFVTVVRQECQAMEALSGDDIRDAAEQALHRIIESQMAVYRLGNSQITRDNFDQEFWNVAPEVMRMHWAFMLIRHDILNTLLMNPTKALLQDIIQKIIEGADLFEKLLTEENISGLASSPSDSAIFKVIRRRITYRRAGKDLERSS